MTNPKLVKIVRQGRRALAAWRQKYSDILVDLVDADLSGVNLRGANLRRADLTGANLTGADLVGANLTEADLTRATLRDAKLIRAYLLKAVLFKADLSGADLSGAQLRMTSLRSADLRGTRLRKADLKAADLDGANLGQSDLVGADLSYAKLGKADFHQVTFGETRLGDVDLSRVLQLDSAKHVGPSTVGIDTLYCSEGKIPEAFLRGCGVPEAFVANWSTLRGHPFEQFMCFICHSHEEQSFATRLHETLSAKGIRCWLDEKPKQRDEDLQEPMLRALGRRDRILLCASKNSLSSWWVQETIDSAFEAEQRLKKEEGRDLRILLPLNLDGFMFSGDWNSPHEKAVAARVAGDFVGWRRNKSKFVDELEHILLAIKGEKAGRKK